MPVMFGFPVAFRHVVKPAFSGSLLLSSLFLLLGFDLATAPLCLSSRALLLVLTNDPWPINDILVEIIDLGPSSSFFIRIVDMDYKSKLAVRHLKM